MAATGEKPTLRRRATRHLWSFRREALVAAGVAGTGGLVLAAPFTRRWVAGVWQSGRIRRLLHHAFVEAGIPNRAGLHPQVRRVRRMPYGFQVTLRVRPGQWADLFELRAPILSAAMRAVSVRVDKNPKDSSRVTLDVVRVDPFAATGDLRWLGLDTPTLSLWDDVHIGTTEMGVALYLSLVERGMIIGGLPGSGKSTFLRLLVAHAAKSPDAQLLLIDPNKQFAAWRDLALAYAANDPAEALNLLGGVQREVDRRLDWLATLPGSPEKLTRELSAEHGVPLWLLVCDELAYHTSVVGTGESRAVFAARLRDIEARCRAAGIVVVVATQRPTDKVVPRELGDLFPLRVAFHVSTPGNSDVILGEGWAKKGFNAADIALTSLGQGLLLAEGGKPVKFKAARISSADLSDLSVTTIPLKPRHRDPVTTVAAEHAA